jgi:hypothetical protein
MDLGRGSEAIAGRTTEAHNDQESTTSRSLCNTGGDSRDAFRKRQPLGDATTAIRYGLGLYGLSARRCGRGNVEEGGTR